MPLSSSEGDYTSLPSLRDPMTANRDKANQLPSVWLQVFTSVFSPSWILGLLLFSCLFLPSHKGCNDETIYVSKVLVSEGFEVGDFYLRFLFAWPFLLGLIISIGTLLLVSTRQPTLAQFLWWSFAVLIVAYASLLMAAMINEPPRGEQFSEWKLSEVLFVVCWLGIPLILLLLLPITFFYSNNWFNAAMWMQLSLALTAAVCLSIVLPALGFATRLLIGSKLSIACSVLLIVTTIVQRIDGNRALTRKRGESRLQLSLMSLLLLFMVGGVACAWIGRFVFINFR